MPKIILDKIKQKISTKKEKIQQDATTMSYMTLDKQFKLFFYAIDGYITTNPNKKQRLAFNSIIPLVVDGESTCDDEGYQGMKIKERCKIIGKENPLTEQSITWLKNELKPYFEDSLKTQTNKTLEMLGVINETEAHEAYDIYSKKQNALQGVYK